MAPPLLRVAIAAGERRLCDLLGGRDAVVLGIPAAVEAALVQGSLALAGLPAGGDDALRLRRARAAVPADAPLTVDALLAWHGALVPGAGLRTGERAGGAPAPLVRTRLLGFEEWMGVEAIREVPPAARGALALARIVEIAPFDAANGRVSRLACAHVMARAGARPPLLDGGDAARLEEATTAAFALHTEPLVRLLEEASDRALQLALRIATGG
jgi:hypothetical protein